MFLLHFTMDNRLYRICETYFLVLVDFPYLLYQFQQLLNLIGQSSFFIIFLFWLTSNFHFDTHQFSFSTLNQL